MIKITKQSISLGDLDRKIIKGLADGMGTNFSAAVRFIVRDWYSLQKENQDDPDLNARGKNVLSGT